MLKLIVFNIKRAHKKAQATITSYVNSLHYLQRRPQVQVAMNQNLELTRTLTGYQN